MSDPQVDQ